MMLATTTNSDATRTKPRITGRLPVSIACTESWPRPLRPKTCSTARTTAAPLVPKGCPSAEWCTGTQPVPVHHSALGHPFGTSGADVVLAQGVDQRPAGQTGVDGRLDRG